MSVPEVGSPVRSNQQSDDEISMIAVAVPGLIFLPLNLVASLFGGPAVALAINMEDDHPKVLWATSPLWGPLALAGAILALPAGLTAAGIHFAAKKIKESREKNKIKKYEEDRGPTLQDASSTYLANLLNHRNVLFQPAEHLMPPASECLKQVKAGIPQMIMTDRQLYEKLENDKRSKEEIKETYIRLKEDCEDLRSNASCGGSSQNHFPAERG